MEDSITYTWPPDREPLSCRMIALLISRNTRQRGTPWHSHAYWQLEIVTTGGIEFETHQQGGVLHSGEFILLPPGSEHRFAYTQNRFGWVSICFQADGVTSATAEVFSPCRLSRLLVSTARRKTIAPHHKAEMEGLVCSLLAHCYPLGFVSDKPDLLSRIDEFLLAQPGRFATVEDVAAAAVGYSANHLSTLVRRQTGASLKKYIDEFRNQHARHLLRFTTLPMSDVAGQVGCDTIYDFSRFFKRLNRQSPRAYRNEQHG